MATEIETIAQLERTGFKGAAEKLKRLQEKKRKLMIAYEHFRFLRQEKVDDFNQKLKEKTIKRGAFGGTEYQMLAFTPVERYGEVPPADVLLALEEAQNRQCFDSFEVAHIVDVKDPILFGRINECSDRFYIAQWDNDISIEELLMPNEG